MNFASWPRRIGVALVSLAASGLGVTDASAEDLAVTFSHVLSDFNGPVRVGVARMAVDREFQEILVAVGRDVRVFNDVGMQVFQFRTSIAEGSILDLAVDPAGRIFTLTPDLEAPGDQPRIFVTRHDFRGVPLDRLELTGLPARFEGFLPNRVLWVRDRLYFANTTTWLVAVAGLDGAFERGHDIADILGIPEDERESREITGFSVDAEGNLLLTCAMTFRAYVISPEGEMVGEWGEAGSIPGTFGVVAGIARDPSGRTYIVDKNRGVVMVFDQNHRFLMEFGGDPSQDGGALRVPDDVLADGKGRIYVTQLGRSGISAYVVRKQ